MSEESNIFCVRQHFEVLWNAGEVSKIDEFFSPNFVNFGISYSDARGIIQMIVSVWRTAFPDLHFQIDHLLCSENNVMCEVTLSGTHLGEFVMVPPLNGPPIKPNGRSFHVKHVHRFRLQDSKIVEHFAVRDDLRMFQQLGHVVVRTTDHADMDGSVS
ncbi:ester cyclase [Occallatibacter savannae]|uniref:ester cyclase n=1 Tax=Occallatibacter savannae TaxID=1002691 RepID=UPI000D68E1DB|nr:ester cyclase [Occallatibacter savannae]